MINLYQEFASGLVNQAKKHPDDFIHDKERSVYNLNYFKYKTRKSDYYEGGSDFLIEEKFCESDGFYRYSVLIEINNDLILLFFTEQEERIF